jgi:MFS family permease
VTEYKSNVTARRPVPRPRWWIGGILFASTVINYIDRQTLSLLAPYLKLEYHWTNTDDANTVVAFRVAYSIGQTLCGRLMDRLGTKRGLTITVLWYSIVSVLTTLARGYYGFLAIRFLLGAAESGNWPGATKAVSEWFPKQQRGLATALFDSGSSIGGALAPFVVFGLYFRWGFRVAFIVPGLPGFLWLIVRRRFYYRPREHPRISDAERQMILADAKDMQTTQSTRPKWHELLKLPQTWDTIVARTFTDPVFFFIADWFPIYLVAKGISLHRRGSGQFLRRCCPRLSHQAWLVGGSSTQEHGASRWLWRHTIDSHCFHCQPPIAHTALRASHLLLRLLHDHRQRAAVGSQHKSHGTGTRAQDLTGSPGQSKATNRPQTA